MKMIFVLEYLFRLITFLESFSVLLLFFGKTYALFLMALSQVVLPYKITFTWSRFLASLWKKLSTFQDSVMQYKIAAMPIASWGFQTTSETFQIRYSSVQNKRAGRNKRAPWNNSSMLLESMRG